MNLFTNLLGKKRVRMHLKDDAPSIEGILMSSGGGNYTLVAAKAITGETESYSLEGTVVIQKKQVLFFQVLPAE